MNKNCARCLKVVYPIEELKCLDKVCCKFIFQCAVCRRKKKKRKRVTQKSIWH
jgi:hypothetical protein